MLGKFYHSKFLLVFDESISDVIQGVGLIKLSLLNLSLT